MNSTNIKTWKSKATFGGSLQICEQFLNFLNQLACGYNDPQCPFSQDACSSQSLVPSRWWGPYAILLWRPGRQQVLLKISLTCRMPNSSLLPNIECVKNARMLVFPGWIWNRTPRINLDIWQMERQAIFKLSLTSLMHWVLKGYLTGNTLLSVSSTRFQVLWGKKKNFFSIFLTQSIP